MRAPIRPLCTTNVRTLIEYEPADGRDYLRLVRSPTQAAIPKPVAVPEPRRLTTTERAHHVVRTVLEVLDGRRPANQVRELLSERAYCAVLAGVRARRASGLRLRRLHTYRASPVALEVSATVLAGPRVRAAAARLELCRESWLCTDFGLL